MKSLQTAPASQIWPLAGIAVVGVILMLSARFILQSPFVQTPRESSSQGG